MGHHGSTTRPRSRGGESQSQRDKRACVHGTLRRPLQAQLAPGKHRSLRAQRVTVVTAGTAGPAGSNSTTDTTCIETGQKAGQRRAAQTDVAARAARGDCNFGRASERFVSERLRRGERWRPGLLARRLSGERPATAVTAGTEPVTAGAGVTAPGHSSHGAGHGSSNGLQGAGHSDHGDGERQTGPVSAAASAAVAALRRLSPGRAGGTNQQGKQNEPLGLFWLASCSF